MLAELFYQPSLVEQLVRAAALLSLLGLNLTFGWLLVVGVRKWLGRPAHLPPLVWRAALGSVALLALAILSELLFHEDYGMLSRRS